MTEMNSALAWLATFGYWPEVIAFLGSAAVAWFTAWRTSRSEVLKSFRAKRVETYEETLDLYSKLIQDAKFIFTEEFGVKSALLDLRLRAYGSKQAQANYSKVIEDLESRRVGYFEAENGLESRYMPEELIYADDGSPEGVQTHAMIDVQEYEEMLEEEKTRRTPSNRELDGLFNPVIVAIRKSSLRAKD